MIPKAPGVCPTPPKDAPLGWDPATATAKFKSPRRIKRNRRPNRQQRFQKSYRLAFNRQLPPEELEQFISARLSRLPPGESIPIESLDNNFSSPFKCCICMDYFVNPQVFSCNHFYCALCINSWFNRLTKLTCPICQRDVKAFERSLIIEQCSGILNVTCKCSAVIPLSNYEEHKTQTCLLLTP